MAGLGGNLARAAGDGQWATRSVREPAWVRRTLVAIAVTTLLVLLVVPLVVVFVYALREGIGVYPRILQDADTLSAIRLTLTAAAVSVPVNIVFGLAASWWITRFRFPGRNLLITLIDLPLTVSPVVAGLVFVLLFGAHSALGAWLQDHGIRVVFAVPGIVLATVFVTFPFVARELIPLMQAQGAHEEEAALSLGASGWVTFVRVTLPRIKWGLLYGVLLCTARAMGEFGAVSVVSGHIRGRTNTLPLHIEILHNEYQSDAAFACASLLAGLALLSLVARKIIEHRAARDAAASLEQAE